MRLNKNLKISHWSHFEIFMRVQQISYSTTICNLNACMLDYFGNIFKFINNSLSFNKCLLSPDQLIIKP